MTDSPVTYDVVVVGSANLDLVTHTTRLPGPGETVLGGSYAEHAGGKGLNQAIAAARCGASVAFVGAVGDDEPGQRLRAIAASEGIDVTHLATATGVSTGRALITVDQQGENTIVVVPGANHEVTLAAADGLPVGRVTLVQLEIPIEQVAIALQAARAAGSLTILNPAPAVDLPEAVLAASDLVVPNEHELELIGGVDELMERGVATVVVTLGAAGVAVTDATASVPRHWAQPAFAVDPVDTTGAGDAFCGALAARLAAKTPRREGVEFAAAAGALATTIAGAVPSLPRRPQIDELVRHARSG